MTVVYRLAAPRLAALCLIAGLVAPAVAAADGKSLYMDNCSACHQVTGKGVKGAFPALAGSPLVQGDPKIVASTVLNGRAGMPAFKDDLSDADLAAILTYVRSSWGNKAPALAPKQIAAARGGAKTASRGLQAH
ncbi:MULTISPECIES: cytochrome c [unclassified Caulobacter]|jgi:mono/diheme cytochrome c family protein|uniref:c-type cytochrome n=1 Tax=unclassified Caulobacter TaxID=2648921 RepID=UPI000785BB38|nr:MULTISPECIES: cytochrome c [unclassified Caulobacter]AZS20607.1 cytochrome c [Caulobacter sp. FWC26]